MEGFKPVRLSYNTHEPATGADEKLLPIIYLHGLSAVKEYWFDLPQKIADATKRRSYTVDARNHGESERSDQFSFDWNVEDLFHFLDTLEIQKAVLVGHSMGGVTSIQAALKRPDRVESIIVEDMYVRKVPKPGLDGIAIYLRALNKYLGRAPTGLSNDETFELVFQQLLEKAPPELIERVKKGKQDIQSIYGDLLLRRNEEGHLSMKCNVNAIVKAIADYEAFASEPEGVFDGPALFIYGTLSPFKVGDQKEHIKQFFPKAVFEGIEEEHSLHVPKPVEFTDAVLKFLL